MRRTEPLLPAAGPDEDTSKNFGCRPFHRVNHNVVLQIAMRAGFGLADGVWSGTVLAAYLFHIGGNRYAGFAEAALGISSLVVALPAGWLADRTGKARIVSMGGLLLPFAVALSAFAVIWSSAHPQEKNGSFALFLAALALWGAVQSIANGPAQALYADSIATGERSRYFQIAFTAYMVAQCCGPVISIVLFVLHDNSWDPLTLRNVLLVGLGLEAFPGLCMLFFRERCTLDDERSGKGAAAQATASTTAATAATAASATSAPEATAAPAATPATAAVLSAASCSLPASSTSLPPLPSHHRRAHLVPYILFASSLTAGFASGMTIKFFPLYFRCTCGMSPAAVQGIFAGMPLVLALFSRLATCLAKRVGRVQVGIPSVARACLPPLCHVLCPSVSLPPAWLLSRAS
jgi:MFS family permease